MENEKPILMSAPMVRAILEGRKTQTRRAMKAQPPEWVKYWQDCSFGEESEWYGNDRDVDVEDLWFWPSYEKSIKCPYGKPGDRLWVRETWRQPYKRTETDSGCIYLADGPDYNTLAAQKHTYGKSMKGWKPSIHMPRWASRITLEITDVRVERLNDISEEDARAEGCKLDLRTESKLGISYKSGFANLWDNINGKGSWDKNPWVWVIEFKRVEDANGK